MDIRTKDLVVVTTGDDAGKTARVLRILTDKGKIVVEGVNRVYRHVKPNRRNQQGGRLSKEMPIDVSNVQLVCPSCNKGVRVGRREVNGVKERFCKKCDKTLSVIVDKNKAR